MDYGCITIVVYNIVGETLCTWDIQTGIQNESNLLVYVEASFGQHRTISKLLCDCRFRKREVCRKTDCLYSTAKSLFLTKTITKILKIKLIQMITQQI